MKDTKKYQKAQNTYKYQNKVLAACETLCGPCQSVEEFNAALLRADNEANCLTPKKNMYYKICPNFQQIGNVQGSRNHTWREAREYDKDFIIRGLN